MQLVFVYEQDSQDFHLPYAHPPLALPFRFLSAYQPSLKGASRCELMWP